LLSSFQGATRKSNAIPGTASSVHNKKKLNHPMPKVMTDLVSTHYTLVMETEFPDMATFEKSISSAFDTPEWKQWYPEFRALMTGGHREIFSIVD